jgi:phosphopantothenoylcysteine decarboxylase/phosphopantothenate--cysteine ligase
MHPIEDIRGSKSSKLAGKRIVLGITGSIAAVECVKLARELARHGADVIPVMSPASLKLVHQNAIHFATGHEPIIDLDGTVKHVELCGECSGRADLLLIAPATANTISKIACGIDDTPVTTMASCALGSGMPMIIVPAMHQSMYKHQAVLENIKRLKDLGVEFVGPKMQERKAKMVSNDEILTAVFRSVGPKDLFKKKVLVITGSTKEPIDDVRFITNYSTGETGIQLALEAHRRGADVEVWAGENVIVPDFLLHSPFKDSASLFKMVVGAKADFIFVPAAISDFKLEKKKGKLSSKRLPSLKFGFAPKIVERLRINKRTVLVVWKADTGISKKELKLRARELAARSKASAVIANLLENVKKDSTCAMILVRGKATIEFSGTKAELASKIIDEILRI